MLRRISVALGRATFASACRNEGSRVRVEGRRGGMSMADNKSAELPEGTDTVIAGAARTDTPATGTVTVEETATVIEREIIESGGASEPALSDRLRTGRERIASQAGEKARGIVTQGLE